MALDQNAIANDLRPLNLALAAAPGATGQLPPPPDLLLAHHPHGSSSPHQFYTSVASPASDLSPAGFSGPFAAWPGALFPRQQQALPNGFPPEQAVAPAVASCAPSSNDGVPEEPPRSSPSSLSSASRKLKFLCSFGGKILPRPSDGALRYVGGHTRIIALRKDASFQELMQKMSETYGGPTVLKYQLPDEDLDALVTVSCPEDLENMIEEYDKLAEASAEGSAKLRVFLFSLTELDASGLAFAFDVHDTGQRYVEAVNGIAEKEVAGIKRKESVASLSSTQTSDGVPAELLESTADGAPSAIAPPAVAPSWVPTSQEPPGSVCPDLPSNPILWVSGMTTVPTNVPGSAGIPSNQIFSSKLDQPQPPSAGTPYMPPAYMESLHDGFNHVEYIQNPSQMQYLNPQQLGAPVNFVANQPHSYVPAVHVTAAIPAAQVSSGKPVRSLVEPCLDDGPCGGRAVQVAANPTLKPFQALSQFPPLPHSLLPNQNVERYGMSQVPHPTAMPVQTLRFEDCGLCQRNLPHAHSDILMQEHGGSVAHKTPVFHTFNSEEIARSHVPLRVGDGATQNSAVMHQADGSITLHHLGACGYPQVVESQKDVEAVPYEAESLGKTKILQPPILGFSGPVQAPYGVHVSNQTQGWHEDLLQQQLPLATSQYLLKQEPLINNAVGTNITSARNENTQKSEFPVRDLMAEFSCDYSKPAERMMGASPLNYSQPAGLNEYLIPVAEPNLSDSVLIEETMKSLRISPCDTSAVFEPRRAVSKNIFNAQNDLKPENSLLSVEAMDNMKQNIAHTDVFFAETSTGPGKVAEVNKLVDLLPSSTLEVSRIHNLQPAEPNQACPAAGNPTPPSRDLELGSEPPIPHEWLLQGSSATNKVTVSDWKDESSQLYSGNAFTDIYAPSTGTSPFPLSSMAVHNVHLGDIQEPGPSESLFSNLEPWQIMHNTHLLPPKPRRIASRDTLLTRDSSIQKSSGNNGESNPSAQLEEGNHDHPLDSLIKKTCSDMSTTHPIEGTAEELIKKELQAVAEGVAASVLQQSSPVPGLLPYEDGSLSESIKDREVHENNIDSQSSASHVDHNAEGSKSGQLDKSNLGFQIMEDIGHLQIIKNSDLEELRELGSGTFGTVYHGKWRGTDVAIKRINDRCFAGKLSEQERLRADFWNEASKLADLHHPNVVAFYGVVLDGPGGSVATVTEYMVNGSLRQALQKNHKTLDRRKCILIAMDVAFGMEYLHGKNIVHFDLKSDNLLVNLRDPQRPICKVFYIIVLVEY
ncbi:hypothetical protein Taro_048649 [Colocasia esculenta]|uniref:Protein kinase domain-containing protein n=1 Tax=Colocasia esculenta TaxID=4460 RepID=A0A843X8S6_COLES|nr:hypothetical protein [Colocasia esculenta]